MAQIELSIAIGDYDRTRPLQDGRVQIDGVRPIYMNLYPEEMFFRAFRHAEFDVAELSLSSFSVRQARGDNEYVGIPVFLSRAFRHNAIYVRTDRIKRPEDLKGKKIGLPEFQLTAVVWARALLEDDYGIGAADVTWVRGGIDEPNRHEKIDLHLPADVQVEDAPAGRTISELLATGEIDGFIAPRAPTASIRAEVKEIGWLFPKPSDDAADYYRRTGIFPIMHLLGLRRTIVEQHPWVAAALLKAFTESKQRALAHLEDTSASKVTLPFIDELFQETRALMGADFWPYGVAPNRKPLETFLRHHHQQGLSSAPLSVDDLFYPTTYETARI